MRITIDSTSVVVLINGQKCRVWEGSTETGEAIRAYVAMVQVEDQDKDVCQELVERPEPAGAIRIWPRVGN